MNNKLKILYLITQSEWGGAQRYVWDLGMAMKENFDVSMAAGGEDGAGLSSMTGSIPFYPLKNLVREINPIKDVEAFFEIRNLLKKIKPQILHSNSTKAGVLGSLAAVGLGIKVVYTVHGWVFLEPLPAWKKWFYLLCERISCWLRHSTILLSQKELELSKLYKLDCGITKIIKHGISPLDLLDKEAIRKKISERFHEPISAKTWIGTIANLYKTKDIPNLIEALKNIDENFVAIIIGDGPERANIEDLIKKAGMTERVFLLTNKNIAAERWLNAFDLFVLPSAKEGFPYVILEAMAAGLPIVATNVGAIPEMIEDKKSGLLVPSKNPGLLRAAIKSLFKDENLRSSLGQNAKMEFSQKFSKEKMISEVKNLYNQLLFHFK